ncbi:UPF0149 family protein [Curvibacter sp. APW13]|uniref:YecA/YgfB family protein n=1 Tax=Curvibacter sp. APW13 TaxID=3077236 RepID=UPI0028DF8EC7|nr:UPF0149 family protein [Curvibacter sp. APW13]MDT8990662.1 UPF0149 family protein [Curvibacter sp. APW13]
MTPPVHPDLSHWYHAFDESTLTPGALSSAECAELFELFSDAGLVRSAMSAEMADGFLTACAVGPVDVPVPAWMAAVFGQPQLPVCADTARQERLLQLLLRRYRHVQASTANPPTSADPHTLFLPLQATVDEARRVSPYRCNAQGVREGDWELKDWAEGFRRAMLGGGHWQPMLGNQDAWPLISPIVLFQSGYNPDKPELQIDQRPEMRSMLVRCIYEMRQWWRAYALAQSRPAANPAPATPRRDQPKVGRNDPCPCGSGQKYKKCCGAH